MKGVTEGGMGITTRKWQPHGWIIPGVKININTPAIYEPNTAYSMLDYNETQDSKELLSLESDAEGRIGFSVNHERHQIIDVKSRNTGQQGGCQGAGYGTKNHQNRGRHSAISFR